MTEQSTVKVYERNKEKHKFKIQIKILVDPRTFQGLEISANGSENVTIYQAKWVCLQ